MATAKYKFKPYQIDCKKVGIINADNFMNYIDHLKEVYPHALEPLIKENGSTTGKTKA